MKIPDPRIRQHRWEIVCVHTFLFRLDAFAGGNQNGDNSEQVSQVHGHKCCYASQDRRHRHEKHAAPNWTASSSYNVDFGVVVDVSTVAVVAEWKFKNELPRFCHTVLLASFWRAMHMYVQQWSLWRRSRTAPSFHDFLTGNQESTLGGCPAGGRKPQLSSPSHTTDVLFETLRFSQNLWTETEEKLKLNTAPVPVFSDCIYLAVVCLFHSRLANVLFFFPVACLFQTSVSRKALSLITKLMRLSEGR